MAGLPKRKHSTRRKGKRRAAIKLTSPRLISCPNCHVMTFPHQVCPACGFYKGRQVLKIKVKKKEDKEEKKLQ